MYNVNFNSIEEAMKLNNLSKEQVVYLFKQFLNNQNYRKDYNNKKNELTKLLKNDPIVIERMKKLSNR